MAPYCKICRKPLRISGYGKLRSAEFQAGLEFRRTKGVKVNPKMVYYLCDAHYEYYNVSDLALTETPSDVEECSLCHKKDSCLDSVWSISSHTGKWSHLTCMNR